LGQSSQKQPSLSITLVDAIFGNGLAFIRGSPNIIFLRTGESHIVLQDPMFVNSSTFPLGINGINTFGRDLYFTNSAQGMYGKVAIRSDGSLAGKEEKIAPIDSSKSSYDDFTMDKHGNGLLAVKSGAVRKVTPNRKQSVLSVGPGSSYFSGPTSVIFGRGSRTEEATLYVSTGGLFDPVSGNFGGSHVVAIDNYRYHMAITESFHGVERAMSLLWKQQASVLTN